MKKSILTIVLIILSNLSYAQDSDINVIKKEAIGEKYVFTDIRLFENMYSNDPNDKTNIVNDKPVVFTIGSTWSCIDIVNKYSNNYYILEDNKGQQVEVNAIFLYEYFHEKGRLPVGVFFGKDAKKYKKRYGSGNWNRILNGKVRIGWSKKMCELSWGKPEDINKTTNSYGIKEQWVYDNSYLYFENGKLTTIQN